MGCGLTSAHQAEGGMCGRAGGVPGRVVPPAGQSDGGIGRHLEGGLRRIANIQCNNHDLGRTPMHLGGRNQVRLAVLFVVRLGRDTRIERRKAELVIHVCAREDLV